MWYLSIQDSTGDVERALGRHADFLASHVGAAESDGGRGVAEVCLSIHSEGPQSMKEVMRTGPGGELLFTDSSRRCAQLWLATHGRRFGYRKRSDLGKRKTGWRLKGSAKAAHLSQQRALDTLAEEAPALAAAQGWGTSNI